MAQKVGEIITIMFPQVSRKWSKQTIRPSFVYVFETSDVPQKPGICLRWPLVVLCAYTCTYKCTHARKHHESTSMQTCACTRVCTNAHKANEHSCATSYMHAIHRCRETKIQRYSDAKSKYTQTHKKAMTQVEDDTRRRQTTHTAS